MMFRFKWKATKHGNTLYLAGHLAAISAFHTFPVPGTEYQQVPGSGTGTGYCMSWCPGLRTVSTIDPDRYLLPGIWCPVLYLRKYQVRYPKPVVAVNGKRNSSGKIREHGSNLPVSKYGLR